MEYQKSKHISNLIQKLGKRDERVDAFIKLCKTRCVEAKKHLIETLNKMSWEEALSVSEYLAYFNKEIILDLRNLTENSERPSVYTSAIKALGFTKSEAGFKFLFPMLINKEKKILSNPLTFGETIDALVRCGKGHLNELIQLLNSSDWLVRSGGVYACGRIAADSEFDQTQISQLKNKIRLIAKKDRSTKVQILARIALSWITGEQEVVDTYEKAMRIVEGVIQGLVKVYDLSLKYRKTLEQIFRDLGYSQMPERNEYGNWNIENQPYRYPITLAIEEDTKTGEGYLNIYTRVYELPDKNILAFYRRLLEWNEYFSTTTAKIFVSNYWAYISEVRKLDSLNVEETVNAIQRLVELANEFYDSLANEFGN